MTGLIDINSFQATSGRLGPVVIAQREGAAVLSPVQSGSWAPSTDTPAPTLICESGKNSEWFLKNTAVFSKAS